MLCSLYPHIVTECMLGDHRYSVCTTGASHFCFHGSIILPWIVPEIWLRMYIFFHLKSPPKGNPVFLLLLTTWDLKGLMKSRPLASSTQDTRSLWLAFHHFIRTVPTLQNRFSSNLLWEFLKHILLSNPWVKSTDLSVAFSWSKVENGIQISWSDIVNADINTLRMDPY